MKPVSFLFLGLLLAILPSPLLAQAGRGGGMFGSQGGPKLSGPLTKLFGEHKSFAATMVSELEDPTDKTKMMTMPAKLTYNEGNSRLDVDLAEMRGGPIRPEMTSQLKLMGMAEMSMISRPDRKLAYLVYPGLKSYAENPIPEEDAATPDKKYTMKSTELSKETVEGHPCVQNKVVITDEKGKEHSSVVWNATDLKNFPVRIDHGEGSQRIRMTFKDIKFEKANTALFEPPKEFARYENMQTMMQEAMMKKLGAGAPPAKK